MKNYCSVVQVIHSLLGASFFIWGIIFVVDVQFPILLISLIIIITLFTISFVATQSHSLNSSNVVLGKDYDFACDSEIYQFTLNARKQE